MANDFYNTNEDFTPYDKVRSQNFDDEFALVAAGFDKLPGEDALNSGNSNFVVAGGTADAITAAMPTTLTTLTGKDGYRVSFKASANNTGAATLNVDSLGAKALTDLGGSALAADHIVSGRIYDAIYHETDDEFVLVNADTSAAATSAAASAASAAAAATSEANAAADEATVAAAVADIQGRQTLFVPAIAMVSTLTDGATRGVIEVDTNRPTVNTLDFDSTADEKAQFSVQMPKGWDASTVAAQFLWSHPSTATNFGVRFFIQAVALDDGDAMNTAFGTAVGHTADVGGTTDDIYATPETGAITIAGTPSKSDWVVFQVYRDVSDAGDTLAVDARLHGVSIFYDIDAYSDD